MKLKGKKLEKVSAFVMERLKDTKIPADTKVHTADVKVEAAADRWSCQVCKGLATLGKRKATLLFELESETGFYFPSDDDDPRPKNVWLGYSMNFCSPRCCKKFLEEL